MMRDSMLASGERRRRAGRLARAALLAAAVIGGATAMARDASAQDIVLGEGIAISWGQFFVADEQKLWEQQGLTPKAVTFASGRLVLDALVGGAVTLGTAAETPIVFAALNGLPVRVIGTMNRHEPFDLVAIKDIKTGKDIKGRKIGYSQGTNAHYYMEKLLKDGGLSWSDVTAISLSPGDFVSSLTSGSLDGFIWTEPHISQALAQGGDKVHVIRSPGIYNTYSCIITLQSTIDTKPDLLVKALKALIAADESMKKDSAATAALVAARIKLDPDIARKFWPRVNFEVTLDKAGLVKELESQAKWAMENKLARPDAKMPDNNAVVVTQLLEAARKP